MPDNSIDPMEQQRQRLLDILSKPAPVQPAYVPPEPSKAQMILTALGEILGHYAARRGGAPVTSDSVLRELLQRRQMREAALQSNAAAQAAAEDQATRARASYELGALERGEERKVRQQELEEERRWREGQAKAAADLDREIALLKESGETGRAAMMAGTREEIAGLQAAERKERAAERDREATTYQQQEFNRAISELRSAVYGEPGVRPPLVQLLAEGKTNAEEIMNALRSRVRQYGNVLSPKLAKAYAEEVEALVVPVIAEGAKAKEKPKLTPEQRFNRAATKVATKVVVPELSEIQQAWRAAKTMRRVAGHLIPEEFVAEEEPQPEPKR